MTEVAVMTEVAEKQSPTSLFLSCFLYLDSGRASVREGSMRTWLRIQLAAMLHMGAAVSTEREMRLP